MFVASPEAQNTAVTINVDANANRHSINPNVYGVAHASTTELTDLNVPLNRNGGNNTTRYNWQLNADNRGNGRSRAASMLGSSNTPIASTAGTANRNIIVVPCVVNSWV